MSEERVEDGGGRVPSPSRPAGAARRVLTRAEAEQLVPRRALAPVQRFLVDWHESLAAELDIRIWGFGYSRLAEYPESFGRLFYRGDAPVPQLWFGIGWAVDDAPGTLPSWGASLQVDGAWVQDMRRGAGGLRAAVQAAARDSDARLGIYETETQVELAEWQDLEWLLETEDQVGALLRYWGEFLDLLAQAELPESMDAFVDSVFGSAW